MIRLLLFLSILISLAGQGPFANERDLMFQSSKSTSFKNLEAGLKQENNSQQLSPSRSLVYSLALPGLAQYLNNDRARAYLYLGLEVLAITLYSSFNSEGDRQTGRVEDYVNNETGFDRIKYFRNIYIAEHGAESLPSELLGSDSGGAFGRLKENTALYADLQYLENLHGDGVHSLPSTKTQQYYEMVGKYYSFYHGWKHSSMSAITVSQHTGETPEHIEKYYTERDKMNLAYKRATWAITGLLVNHVISGLEAFISSKKRLHIAAESSLYRNETIQTVKLRYEF
jgi:hypothetical protein